MRVCAENGNEGWIEMAELAASQAVLFFCQHHNGAPLRRLIRKRCKLGGVGKIGFGNAWARMEDCRLTVAERDRAGFVEQEHVHISGGSTARPDMAMTFR